MQAIRIIDKLSDLSDFPLVNSGDILIGTNTSLGVLSPNTSSGVQFLSSSSDGVKYTTLQKEHISNLEVISIVAVSSGIPLSNHEGKISNDWLNTGPDNGLDADTLDGHHAYYFSPSDHIHIIADVSGLSDILNDKADIVHSHAISDIIDLQDELDDKAPLAHTHSQSDIINLDSTLSLKADLVDGVIPTSQIPAIAITEFLGAVDSEEEMIELEGQRGDYCYRNDLEAAFWLIDDDYSLPENWLQVAIPTVSVQSVNGQTGIVVLSYSDVGAAPSAHSHNIIDINNLQSTLDDKANLNGANFTGNVTVVGAQLRTTHSSGAVFSIDTVSAGFTYVERKTPSGQCVISFDPVPSDRTSISEIRFFRNVNTTGSAEFTLYRGDGGTLAQHKLRSKGGSTYFCAIDGNFGIGINNPQAKFHSIGSTIVGIATSPVDDGNIGNGQVNIWIDEESDKLMFKCKTSTGTIKTGEIPLA